MENSTTIIKCEIAFLLKELKKLIKLYNDKVKYYLKNKYFFQDVEEMINDEHMNMFNKINFEYFNLAKEFRTFVLRYNVSHDHITESVVNDILKRPIEYILHRRKSYYDTDNETDSDDDEFHNNNEKTIIGNNLQSMINDISIEKSISNNLKQLLVNNLLKQSMINKILKDSTMNNKESMINDILNKKTINNNGNEKTINNNEQVNSENTINKNDNDNKNTFVETPICIKSKKAVLNPKSNDNKSFQYSITLSLYHKEIDNKYNRITKIKPYINNFNWNNDNLPPTKQDYENFEINNDKIALNIYQLNNEEISQLYKSNHNREKGISLLLLENKNTLHSPYYVCIKNLNFKFKLKLFKSIRLLIVISLALYLHCSK